MWVTLLTALLFGLLLPLHVTAGPGAGHPSDDLTEHEAVPFQPIHPPTGPVLQASDHGLFPFGNGPGDLAPPSADGALQFVLAADGEATYLLDPARRRILRRDQAGSVAVFARDDRPGLLRPIDFALTGPEGLVLADATRQALFLFRNFALAGRMGIIGDRRLFQNLQHVFASPEGTYIAAWDAINTSWYLFDRAGTLRREGREALEPCFLGNSLVFLRKDDRAVRVELLDPATGGRRTLHTAACRPGNLVLDAWAATTPTGVLALVIYEGTGDEDHLDHAQVVVVNGSRTDQFALVPNLALSDAFRRPYVLQQRTDGLWLLEGDPGDEGIRIKAYKLY